MNTLVPELVLVESNPEEERLSLEGISASHVPCHVTVRKDGEMALNYLQDSHVPVPTLILLDHSAPAVDGPEILGRLRTHDKIRFVPIVVLGEIDSVQALRECYRLGANSCVAKPPDPVQYEERMADLARYWLETNLALDHQWRHRSVTHSNGKPMSRQNGVGGILGRQERGI